MDVSQQAIHEEFAMSIVILRLPDVERKTEIRPQECPKCEGEIFQRWGKVRKPVRDNRYRSVQVYRYRCCSCRLTFRHYPEGVDRADQTQRLRNWLGTIWDNSLFKIYKKTLYCEPVWLLIKLVTMKINLTRGRKSFRRLGKQNYQEC